MTFHIETWAEFRDHTSPDVAYVIDGVVPVGSVGFVGAGKGCGKTWLCLHAAICTASGRPFLGRFVVPKRRPVVYVALEGMRPNLRARIGALARGLDLDPDGADLDLFHLLYKPRIDLRDETLTRPLVAEILDRDPGLVVFDVLRRAAVVRESHEGSGDFRQVLANTQPLTDAGSATTYPHHNIKPNADSDKRQAGERLSGSGALYGHADFGVFITSYDKAARTLAVEFGTRDEAELGDMTVRLVGQGSGRHGGFTYTDRCVVTAMGEHDAEEQRQEQHEDAIRRHLTGHPGASQNAVVEGVEGKKDDVIATLGRMVRQGVVYQERGKRNALCHWLMDDPRRPSPMMAGTVGEGRDSGAFSQHFPTTTPGGGEWEGEGQEHLPPAFGDGQPAPTPDQWERLIAVLNLRAANGQMTQADVEAVWADAEHLDAEALATLAGDLEADG